MIETNRQNIKLSITTLEGK